MSSMAIFLISLIPYLIFTLAKTKKSFHMLQQNYYNDDNRYFKWILINIAKVAYDTDILFVLLVCTIFFNIGVTIGTFIILYGIIYLFYNKKKVLAKKPLVITARVKRLLFYKKKILSAMITKIVQNIKKIHLFA